MRLLGQDLCAMCGAEVPEGRMVCLICEMKVAESSFKAEPQPVSQPTLLSGLLRHIRKK